MDNSTEKLLFEALAGIIFVKEMSKVEFPAIILSGKPEICALIAYPPVYQIVTFFEIDELLFNVAVKVILPASLKWILLPTIFAIV